MRTMDTRMIVDVDGARAYDLEDDPHELRPRPLTQLELAEVDSDIQSTRPVDAPVPVTDIEVEGLRALGYVQ